jgi:4-hydroxy-tetrahydrodipicolinate synthase
LLSTVESPRCECEKEYRIFYPGQVNATLIRGVFAAVTLTRTPSGAVDLDALAHHLQFLQRAGVGGFVLNGATGEYCLTSVEDLGGMIHRARAVIENPTPIVAAIGGASYGEVLRKLQVAQDAGADGLLLPMPHFFPYEQADLIEFAIEIARKASRPILLYNLPLFTTPLEPETTCTILSSAPAIHGIKDSSGSLQTLRLLKELLPDSNRVIGSDGALFDALTEHLCDGVVSGVASVLPELMIALYSEASIDPLSERAVALRTNLDEFLNWLAQFPVPWGLKMIAAERGLSPCDLPMPLAAGREQDRSRFVAWFHANRYNLLVDEASRVPA